MSNSDSVILELALQHLRMTLNSVKDSYVSYRSRGALLSEKSGADEPAAPSLKGLAPLFAAAALCRYELGTWPRKLWLLLKLSFVAASAAEMVVLMSKLLKLLVKVLPLFLVFDDVSPTAAEALGPKLPAKDISGPR